MSLRQHLARIGRWPRLAAAAACLLLAAVSAIESNAARPRGRGGGAGVVVAARTLSAGHALTAGDLRVTRASTPWPGGLSRSRPLVGRVLAGPVGRGEPVTALRLVDAGLTTGLAPGTVAMPVDVTADVRGLVSAGGRVDLLAVPAGDPDTAAASRAVSAERLAARVLVLAALPPDDSGGAGGCRLVLALDRDDALRIAGARSTRLFQVAALPP